MTAVKVLKDQKTPFCKRKSCFSHVTNFAVGVVIPRATKPSRDNGGLSVKLSRQPGKCHIHRCGYTSLFAKLHSLAVECVYLHLSAEPPVVQH